MTTVQSVARGLLIAGAALAGLGLVMWVAANWDDFGRAGRFALLQAAVLACGLGAAARAAWRAPLAVLALLATGALLAFFSQTYQTGADAWQLFALWAALGLPLALAVRSDVVWAPWALVASVAVALWLSAHTGHSFFTAQRRDVAPHAIAFALLLALNLALGPGLARWTGAGLWARRSMALFAVLVLLPVALAGLFGSRVAPQFFVGLLALAVAAAALASRRGFEIFSISVVALGLDLLLVAGLTHALFNARRPGGEPVFEMLLIGGAGAVLLAGSVYAIMALARRES